MRRVDRPDPLPDGMGLLHIGPPKTGTSAFQRAFHAAREELLARGVHYVSRNANPYDMARVAAGWDGGAKGDRYRRRWATTATTFRTSAARHPVLSSEGFIGAGPDLVQGIANNLGRDTTVLLSLRPMAQILPSAWQQITREEGRLSFEDWLRDVLAQPLGDGPMWSFDIGRHLRVWGEVFGHDRLVLLCGSARDSQIRAAEALLDVPGVLSLGEHLNASPSFAEVELLRHVHLAHGEPDDVEVWRRTMHQAGRELGDRTRPEAGGRIAMPRWAVEAANELDHRMREEIEATDALVVGDLKHLYVDPSGAPETVESPTQIDVATVGWFSAVLASTALATSGYRQGKQQGNQPTLAADSALAGASSSDLLRELAARLQRRVGRRVRR